MKKNQYTYFLIIICLFFHGALYAEQPNLSNSSAKANNYIAVLDLEISGNVDRSISLPLAESIRYEIVNMPDGVYEVIDRANMEKIFKEQGFQQAVCSQPGCAVELGKILGAGRIITGTLSRVGQSYFLSISLINVENGKIENIAEDSCKCALDELISISKHLTDALIKSNIEKNKAIEAASPAGVEKKESQLGFNFINVMGGCFQMSYEGNVEMPMHEVCLDAFHISKYEVTQAQWEIIMGNNPSFNKGCGACPIENVSYNDVMDFIAKLNKNNTKTYRLPTEAEWEYAAKGASNKAVSSNSGEGAWNKETSGGRTHSVGGLTPNSLGIYDIMGNVWEFVSDWYSKEYNKQSLKKNPKGPDIGRLKVIRGGGWNSSGDEPFLYIRKGVEQTVKSRSNGFRLVY